MKKTQLPTRFLLFTLSFFSLLPLALHATDVIYGNCHYREIEGRYAGFRKTEAATTFETDDRITLVYCLRIPRDSVSGTALLVSKVNDDVTLNVRVKKCDTDEVLLEHSVTAAGTRGQNLRLPIIPRMKFPQDTWYRIELQAPEGYQRIQRLTELDFERNGNNPVIDAHLRGFPTPATHLWFGHSTAANAPQDESYEWCYQEVLMPKQWATINTYLMTLGITGGYMGIQKAGKTVQNENGQYTDTIPSTWWNQALFSIWDNGDTDVTPNLATYLRAGALAWGNDKTKRFAKWKKKAVQFLTCARPEERSITLRASDGTDSIIRYPCSLLSTWYKNLDDPEWHYMATIRHSGESHYYSTWYSFIENWADSGGELFRRAYYRNNYQRSVGSGKWYFINKVDLFSQTDYQNFIKNGEITARHRRMDYGHGLASDVPRAFYMQTGGYGQPKDSANVLPLVDDHSCVESINLDSLLATLGKAYQDDSKASMKTLISTHGSKRLMAELVEELISKTNRFEGYTYEAMAPVRELAQTEYSVTDMKKVLLNMAENNQFLRYGNTVKASHICSFRAYMLTTGTDILAVRDHRVVSIPQADADVTDPFNHWIVLRHDDASYYCLYNLGAGSFLAISNGIVLDNVPHKLNLTFSNGKAVFREGGGKFLGFGANNNPVVSSSTKAARLELLDNYNLTPSTSLCYALLEQTTDDGIATGIESLSDSPLMERWAETEGWESASLSDDIAAVYYYDLQGRRIGYALPAGQTVVAHIVLRNGASIVRKIKVGK